jgi:16S rRNA C1402 N4-methylase RsmH
VATRDTELRVVPTASFTRAQANFEAYEPNLQRTETFKVTSSLLDLGVGLVSRRGFSVRPGVLLPLGASDSTKTSYGITASFNFEE